MQRKNRIIISALAITWMAVALTFSKTYLLFFLFIPPAIILILLPVIVEFSVGTPDLSKKGKALLLAFYSAWFFTGLFGFLWGWTGPQTLSYPVLEQLNPLVISSTLQELCRALMGVCFWLTIFLASAIVLGVLFDLIHEKNKANQKVAKNKIFRGLVLLACANLTTIVLPWASILITNPMIVTNSDTGGIGLGALVLVPYMIAGLVVALLNVIVIPILIRKSGAKGVIVIFGIIACLLSAAYLLFVAWSVLLSFTRSQ